MTVQLWRCPICGSEYHSPVPVTDVSCPNLHTHGRKRGYFIMTLVDDSLAND